MIVVVVYHPHAATIHFGHALRRQFVGGVHVDVSIDADDRLERLGNKNNIVRNHNDSQPLVQLAEVPMCECSKLIRLAVGHYVV